MKQSNITTPRTLADCRFEVGYPDIDPPRDLISESGQRAVLVVSIIVGAVVTAAIITGAI